MKALRFFPLSVLTSVLLAGCTLSFNNISAEGQASDVLDEEQRSDAKIDPVLNIPSTLL